MSRFLNPRYAALQAYTPGEQPRDRVYIKLNTNESPYPPAPEVVATVTQQALFDLRLYSDPSGKELREKLAAYYGRRPDEVSISNGSDDLLNFAFMAFGAKGVVFPSISYSFYPVFANLHGISYQTLPLRPDFSIDPAEYRADGQLIVIANPNAPTGLALTRAQIRLILEHNPESVVLIDEAYVDFGAESAVPLLDEFDQLLVVMTYSKSRALAGARLGFALGSRELIADLERLRNSTNPYNVNRLTLAIGAAALDAEAYFRQNCARIERTRARTAQSLQELGFEVLPSQANFLFARREGLSGAHLYEQLKARGILIRHFDKAPIADFVRVTIGTDEEMSAFLRTTKEILQQEGL